MDRELLAAQSGGKLLPELCSLLGNDSNEGTPPDFQRFFVEKRPWKRFCTNVLIRGKWIHSTDIDGNKVLGQWCCSRNSSPEQSSPENIARFLVSKVGPATGVRNAGRRTDFRDKQSRDISGEIFLERNYCPRTGFSGDWIHTTKRSVVQILFLKEKLGFWEKSN